MTAAVLEASKLHRVLAGPVPVTLVADISLSIRRGEFVAIMGPSGSGKSSLLYLLGLLDRPSSGSVFLDGEDTALFSEEKLADIRLRKLGFVFQFHFLLNEFSNLENVMLPMRRLGRLSGAEMRGRAESLLGDLGLGDHRNKKPAQLSGGERQRVAIARALANEPLMILADEPTGALDTKSSANVREILKNLAKERDCAIVAVTHDPGFASAADREIHLLDGRIVSDKTNEEEG